MSHKPGAWPAGQPADLEAIEQHAARTQGVQYERRAREEARRHLIGASVRQHLAEQPTAIAVRAVLRGYIADFHQYAAASIAALDISETSP
ncbi:hypothetical protein ACIQWB_35265 [Streptomyces olivaceus]|uniref:hypothetical protein n=1 Tax=Streptomyces olivaceus TaxID=47716 RepID=UPI003830F238